MTLVERLTRALDDGHARELFLLESDDRDAQMRADEVLMPAAVLVAITDRPDPGVILTQRTANLKRHAGQIAFPGGRIDPGDAGPVEAALREAEEEIALPRAAVQVIGMADRYRTVTGFEVTPVIAVIPPDLPLVPGAGEVESWFEVPLSFLFEPGNQIEQAVEWQGRERRYYEILWNDRRIWGATAAMLVNLGRRLAWPL
jgi:8-oxo-dGTP pyrophosphatase MutT (NUDIX family)